MMMMMMMMMIMMTMMKPKPIDSEHETYVVNYRCSLVCRIGCRKCSKAQIIQSLIFLLLRTDLSSLIRFSKNNKHNYLSVRFFRNKKKYCDDNFISHIDLSNIVFIFKFGSTYPKVH